MSECGIIQNTAHIWQLLGLDGKFFTKTACDHVAPVNGRLNTPLSRQATYILVPPCHRCRGPVMAVDDRGALVVGTQVLEGSTAVETKPAGTMQLGTSTARQA
jgi:hypothetical protein